MGLGEVRCRHRVVSSPGGRGKRGWGGPREGPTPGDGGRAGGGGSLGRHSPAALRTPQAPGQSRDPQFRAEPAVPLPLLAAAASFLSGSPGRAGRWTAARASGFPWSQRPARPLPLCLVTLRPLGTVSWARMLGCGFRFCPTAYPRGAVERLHQLLKNKNKPAACPPACCEAVYGLRLCRGDGGLGWDPAVSPQIRPGGCSRSALPAAGRLKETGAGSRAAGVPGGEGGCSLPPSPARGGAGLWVGPSLGHDLGAAVVQRGPVGMAAPPAGLGDGLGALPLASG